MGTMKKGFLKVLSVIISTVFVMNTVVFAQPHGVYKVRVPEELGQVKERYQGSSDKVVVHIQDAHTSFEAQKNLQKIIQYLVTGEDVSAVAVEGAEGDANLNALRRIPALPEKEKVINALLKEGTLTGAEAAHILTPAYVELIGIEDIDLYDINYDAFVTTLSKREEILDQIEQVENILNDLKAPVYSEKMANFDEVISNYREGTIDFFTYCGKLLFFASHVGIDISSYVNFTMLLEAKSWEEQITFEKVDEERAKVITLVDMHFSNANDTIAQKKYEIFKRELEAFEQAKNKKGADTTQFYSMLRNLAKEARISEQEFANFYTFATYISLFARLDKAGLLEECKVLQREIENALASSEAQKELISLVRNVRLLHDIVELKVLPEDVEYYREHKEQFSSAVFSTFISNHAPERLPQLNLSLLDEILPSVDEFYHFAEERSTVMTNRTIDVLNEQKETVLPLVSGGFHTDGITAVLKEKGISYLVVTPQISEVNEDIPYLDRMLQKPTNFELIITSAFNALVKMLLAEQNKRYRQAMSEVAPAEGVALPEIPVVPIPPITTVGWKIVEDQGKLRLAPIILRNIQDQTQLPVEIDTSVLPQSLVFAKKHYLEQIGAREIEVTYFENTDTTSDVAVIEQSIITFADGVQVPRYTLYYKDARYPEQIDQKQFQNQFNEEDLKAVEQDVVDLKDSENDIIMASIQNVVPEIREDITIEDAFKVLFPEAISSSAFSSVGDPITPAARSEAKAVVAKHAQNSVNVTNAVRSANAKAGLTQAAANVSSQAMQRAINTLVTSPKVDGLLDRVAELFGQDIELVILPPEALRDMNTIIESEDFGDFNLRDLIVFPDADTNTAYINVAHINAFLQAAEVNETFDGMLENILTKDAAELRNPMTPSDDPKAYQEASYKEHPLQKELAAATVLNEAVRQVEALETAGEEVDTNAAIARAVSEFEIIQELVQATDVSFAQAGVALESQPQDVPDLDTAVVLHLNEKEVQTVLGTVEDNEFMRSLQDRINLMPRLREVYVTVDNAFRADIETIKEEISDRLKVRVPINVITKQVQRDALGLIAQENKLIVVGERDAVAETLGFGFQDVVGVDTATVAQDPRTQEGKQVVLPIDFVAMFALELANKDVVYGLKKDGNVFRVDAETLNLSSEDLLNSLKSVLKGMSAQLKRVQAEAASIYIAA